jgi:predicted amidohydrolase
VLVVPAWWPWRRDWVWRTLLRARAIENGVWVFGCCIAGSVFPGEDFSGAGNHVFDPLGEPVRTTDDVFYEVDAENPPALVVDPCDESVPITRVEIV